MALAPWQKRRLLEKQKKKALHHRDQEPRAAGNSPTVNTTDAQYQVALESDLQRLQDIQGHSKRDELKRTELIPRYADYLAGVLESGQGGQNDVVVQVMIWCLDAGPDYFERAFELAEYAMRHGMATPDNYQRDVRNVLTGQLADWCTEQQKLLKSPEPWASKIFEMSAEWDLVDKIRAILFRAKAELLQDENPERAFGLAEKAYGYDKNVGVVPLIKKLNKALSAQEPEQTETPPETPPETPVAS